MRKIIYIICFTVLALAIPKQNFACSIHEEAQKEHSTAVTDTENKETHACCASEESTSSHHQDNSNSCAGTNDCTCSMMMNHFCCFFISQFNDINFQLYIDREEFATLLEFHESTGFSSIFIPPKIG